MEHNILYRYFDENDRLLYVGITKNQFQRFQSHAFNTKWVELIHKATFEHYFSRSEVRQAEIAAIAAENPMFNIQGVAADHPGSAKHLFDWSDHILLAMKSLDDETDDLHGEFVEAINISGQFKHFMPNLKFNFQQELTFRIWDAIESELYEDEFANLKRCSDCLAMLDSKGYNHNLDQVLNKIREAKNATD
jgi:predicted GIY-YIG superfamily endonuclease